MPKMTRIPRPAWARLPNTPVEEYVNDDNLCFTDGENFPDRNRLTGEYYVTDESYEYSAEDGLCVVSLSVHCLEHPWLPDMVNVDYLGFLISLECPASGWPCQLMSMDSASI
jgi:hypothetical protein